MHDGDLPPPHRHLETDELIAPLIDQFGVLELDPADDMFERLVRSVLRQQVSMTAAAAIEARLCDAVEMTPEGVLDASPETLREAGLSRAKVDYVQNVAEAFRDRYTRATFEALDDHAVVEELTTIRGVGQWTAEMQLLFSLGRPDVFPVGDLGVRKGMVALFDREMSRAEMVETAERWRPYRSYATLYLWRLHDGFEAELTD